MARTAKTADTPAIEPGEAPRATTAAEPANRAPRPGSKLAAVLGLLEGETGATITEIMTATGWQQHTVRGALAGAITRKLGRRLASEKIEGRGRVYRITASAD